MPDRFEWLRFLQRLELRSWQQFREDWAGGKRFKLRAGCGKGYARNAQRNDPEYNDFHATPRTARTAKAPYEKLTAR